MCSRPLRQGHTGTRPQHWASVSPFVHEQRQAAGSGPPGVRSASVYGRRAAVGAQQKLWPPGQCHIEKPTPAPPAPCLPQHRIGRGGSGDPATGRSSCPQRPRGLVLRSPGYSRQNLRKSDCSSLRAFRNILPFSVPTTKALSSCTATHATSALSLESAEHCGGSRGVSWGKVPAQDAPSSWGRWEVSSQEPGTPPAAPGSDHPPNVWVSESAVGMNE